MPWTVNPEEILRSFPKHVSEGIELADTTKLPDKYRHVVVCGTGSSANSGDFLKNYLRDEIVVTVIRDYTLPATIGPDTMVFVISQSGNNEEALTAFSDAQKKKCAVMCFTSGGKLRYHCQEQEMPYLNMPQAIPSRYALPFTLFPMLVLLENSKMIKNRRSEMKEVITAIGAAKFEEKAKAIAEKVGGKNIVIVTSPRLFAAANHWKIMFNLDANIPVMLSQFPEMNHSDLAGIVGLSKEWFVFLLKDERDTPVMHRRIEATKTVLKNHGFELLEINIKGDNNLVKLMSAAHLGDWISLAIARARGINLENSPLLTEFDNIYNNKETRKKITV